MIERAVKEVYELLQNQEYKEVARITNAKRLSAEEIDQSISEYGCKLVPYPESVELDVIEVIASRPREWSVVAPVFTEEEGLSDLSIEITVIETGEANFKIELENIHVR